MVHRPRWSLTREAAVALVVSSAFSASALAAEVARVQFARGQVNATDKDGRVRPLARGARLNVGDTVNTERGRAQLKFADGARVSLQPRSAFRIDEFQFRGRADGTEKGFFSLLRGGLRAITGLIGRTNRDTYQVKTVTATIGIRGTEYIAEVVDSLRVTVGGGSISIRNDAGTFVIEQGQTAYIADRNSLPVLEFDKPVLAPQGTEEALGPPPIFPEPSVVAGEQPGAAAPGDPIASDIGTFAIDGESALYLTTGKATVSGNQLTAFDAPGPPGSGQAFSKGTTTVEDASYDGIIGVARWSGGTLSATVESEDGLETRAITVGANQGLHAAFGTPTPTMPTTMTATYGLLAATQATSSDGSLGLGVFSPGLGAGQPVLSVDFASGRVGTDFKVTFADQAYRVTTSGGLYNVGGSEITLLGAAAPGVFANTLSVPTFGIAGNACASGCADTDVLGFFAGDGASRTGFTYRITDAGVTVNGAAAGGPASESATLVAPEPHVASFTIDGDAGPTTKRGIATPQGSNTLTAFDVPASDQWYDKGTTTVEDASGDDTVGVARWSAGTLLVATSAPRQVVVGANQGLHAAFGTPTPTMPTTMAATYGLLAATRATSSDGSLGLGTVASAHGVGEPILSVDFASGRVATDFTVTFPDQAYRVTTSGGLYNIGGSEITLAGGVFGNTSSVPTFGIAGNACAGSGCTSTDVRGFFAGDAAARTGFTYRIADGAIAVNGAVAGGPAATTAQLATDVTPVTAAFAAWQSAAAGNVESYEAHVGTGTATLNSSNHLLAFSGTNDYCCGAGTVTMAQGTATYAESGYDGVIGFGRLANGTASIDGGEGNGIKNLTLSTTQGLHHAFGAPTPSADLTSLAASGMPTATYSLIDATKATAAEGSLGLGTVGPAQGAGQPILSADFASGKIGLDFTVTFPDAGPEQAYRITTNGGLYNVGASEISMINPAASASFQGDSIGTTGIAGGACDDGCDTDVRGFFAGPNASRAGFSYRINENIDGGEFQLGIYGAVNAGPANRMPTLSNSVTSAAVFSGSGEGGYLPDLFGGEGGGTAGLDVSGRLVSYLGTYLTSNFNCCAFGDGTVSSNQQSATFAEAGYDGTVGYGRLSNGTVAVDGGEGAGTTTLSTTQGFHYAFGAVTATMPTNPVIATYGLLGATKATSDDGSLGLGTFSGSLAIDFISQRVGTDFSVAFPSVTYRVMTTGGVASVLTSEMRLDAGSSTFSAGRFAPPSPNTWKNGAPCASGCSSALFGFFAGNNAERAALAYRIYDDADSGHYVSGAAAFAQSGQTPHLTDIALNFAGSHDNIVVPSSISDSFQHLDTTGTVEATTGALIAINEGGNTNIGTARVAEYGGDSTIGWTRWAEGTLAGSGNHANSVLSSNRSFHGAYGPPTPAADMAALAGANVTAAYSLMGGTSPTDATAVSAPGTLNSGSLTARFGAAQVDVNLNVTAAAVTYDVNATNLPIAGSGFGGMTNNVDCSGCVANIQGFFSGAMAARAGVAYTISNGGGPLANGAAGFTKTVP